MIKSAPTWFRPILRFGLLIGADAVLLALFAPDWSRLGHHLANADAWVANDGADRAVATLAGAALWLCAAWVGLALTVIAASRTSGWLGAAGERLAHHVLPATLVRLVSSIAGLSITLTLPIAAAGPASALSAISATAPIPSWPLSPTMPSPSWPLSPTVPTVAISPVPADPGAPAVHAVRPGECLWELAAEQVGPTDQHQIAAQVQKWYSTNRSLIGPDPALIHPGQLLIEPSVTQ